MLEHRGLTLRIPNAADPNPAITPRYDDRHTMDTAELPIPKKAAYTYADYAELPEGAPYELIDAALVMSPSPSVRHQRVVLQLGRALLNAAEADGAGEAFVAPMDVSFTDVDTVQPDLIFVSVERRAIIGEQRIEGPPDLVIEVLSPSTAYLDLAQKKRLYEREGVKEYWVVDPEQRAVDVYTNTEDGFVQHGRVVERGTAGSGLLSRFSIDLTELFRISSASTSGA